MEVIKLLSFLLIHGCQDKNVPQSQSTNYEAAARSHNDVVQLTVIEGAGHFDLIAPKSAAWPAIEAAVNSLLKPSKNYQTSEHY